jgi:two-component system, NarL family, nitrate/nitrite response regulator NarL
MKILLADDSELILKRLQDIVFDYDQVELTGSYRNGMDTLNAMRETLPDLAIVDLKMPDLTGLEVLHEIRKENKTIKIIILTLYTSELYRNKAMMYGADYFFSKTEDFDKIHIVIEEMLCQERKTRKKRPGQENILN